MESNESILHYEILQEKAQSLAKAARDVEESLAALRLHDQNVSALGTCQRDELIQYAAEKSHLFLIQRELCGFRDWPEVAEFYNIPPEILERMGASRKQNATPSTPT